MNETMSDFSFAINPCKEITLFIRILNGFYLSFVFLKGENENPSFSSNIYRDYIYVYTSNSLNGKLHFHNFMTKPHFSLSIFNSYAWNKILIIS